LLPGGHTDKPAPTKLLLVPLQLPLPPMGVFAIRIERALDAAIERPHDADARKHRRAAACHSAASCSTFGSLVI
jgi:hypothetical protein